MILQQIFKNLAYESIGGSPSTQSVLLFECATRRRFKFQCYALKQREKPILPKYRGYSS